MLPTTYFLYLKRQHEYDAALQQPNKQPSPALGKRDGETGQYTVKFANGGEALAGRLTFTGGVPEGTVLKTTQPVGSGAIALHGQDVTPIEPQPKTFAYPATKTIPVKVLFSVKKDGKLVFFIGGDRTPEEIFSLPENQAVQACLQNTGADKNDWLFSTSYRLLTADRQAYASATNIKTISPTISTQNWELSDLPNDLYYAGGGIWLGLSPFPSEWLSFDSDTGMTTLRGGEYTEATWNQRTNYNVPIALSASPSAYSFNMAACIVADASLQKFTGRFTGRIVRESYYYGYSYREDYSSATLDLEIPIAPNTTKRQQNNQFQTALITPDRRQVLFRRLVQSTYYITYGFTESRIIRQGSESALNPITSGFWWGSPPDPIMGWTARETTLIGNTAYRAPTNLFTTYPSKEDLKSIKKIQDNGTGGVKVFSLENNTVVEQTNKKIEVPDLIDLGYEDDPTLFIYSISYYPNS